jgi:hypothetical protein
MRFDGPRNAGLFATIEHLVRLHDGGGWDRENLRLAHRKCNCSRKHDPSAVEESAARCRTVVGMIWGRALTLPARARKPRADAIYRSV